MNETNVTNAGEVCCDGIVYFNDELLTQENPPFYYPMVLFLQVLIILIFVTGYIGNGLTIVLLRHESTLRSFTKDLMYIQAFWDTIVLAVPCTRYYIILVYDVDIRDLGLVFEYCHVIVTYVCLDCAVWHLTALSMERAALVLWPTSLFLKRLTHKHAFMLISGFVVVSVVRNVPAYAEFPNALAIASYLDLIFYSFGPFVFMALSSIVILRYIKRSTSRVESSNKTTNHSALLVVKMILVASLYDMVSNMVPNAYLMALNTYNINNSGHFIQDPSLNFVLYILTMSIGVTSNSTKFYIYNISNPHFRKTFVKIFRTFFRKPLIQTLSYTM